MPFDRLSAKEYDSETSEFVDSNRMSSIWTSERVFVLLTDEMSSTSRSPRFHRPMCSPLPTPCLSNRRPSTALSAAQF